MRTRSEAVITSFVPEGLGAEIPRSGYINVTLRPEIGQFLDAFSHTCDKAALIADEPGWASDEAGRWYYDLAATAHSSLTTTGFPCRPGACRTADVHVDNGIFSCGIALYHA